MPHRPTMYWKTLVIGDSKKLLEIRKSQQRNTIIGALVSILIISLVYIENLLNYDSSYEGTFLSDYLRFIIIFCSLVHMLLIYNYYFMHHQLRKHYKHISALSKLHQDSRTIKFLLFEFSISFISMPPFVNLYYEFYQLNTSAIVSLSDIITPLAFLRLYHLLKCIYIHSHLNDPRVTFYCTLHCIKSETGFILKHLVRQHPVRTTLCFSGSVCIIAGLLLYISERTVEESLVKNI